MRLGRISWLALLASAGLSLSGCSASRSASRADSYEPLRAAEPPYHSSEYDPPGLPEQSPEFRRERSAPLSPQSPIPEPPPVPPAVGVSRVKSVSFLQEVGSPLRGYFSDPEESVRPANKSVYSPIGYTQQYPTGSSCSESSDRCADACAEGCDDSKKFGSCLRKLFNRPSNKPASNFKSIFRRKRTSSDCAAEPCVKSDPCATDPYIDQRQHSVNAPEGCSVSTWPDVRLQNNGGTAHAQPTPPAAWPPDLDSRSTETSDPTDSSEDLFIDLEKNSGRSPENNTPKSAVVPPAPSQPESSQLAEPVPPQPNLETIPAVPAVPDEDNQADNVPLWPRLRPQPNIKSAGHRVSADRVEAAAEPVIPQPYRPFRPATASPNGSSSTGVDTILPQIIPRSR